MSKYGNWFVCFQDVVRIYVTYHIWQLSSPMISKYIYRSKCEINVLDDVMHCSVGLCTWLVYESGWFWVVWKVWHVWHDVTGRHNCLECNVTLSDLKLVACGRWGHVTSQYGKWHVRVHHGGVWGVELPYMASANHMMSKSTYTSTYQINVIYNAKCSSVGLWTYLVYA